MAHLSLNCHPNRYFKAAKILLLSCVFLNLCCAERNDERTNSHIDYQKQKIKNHNHYHHHQHYSHLYRQRSRRNDGVETFHKSSSNLNSVDRFYDLSHAYFDGMPVDDGGSPIELSLLKQDVGEGAR